MDWKEYQEETAQVFRAVGCEAIVNHKTDSARGSNNIDVYVTFEQYGVKCIWIVECKYWNSNVPKEKVFALQKIVENNGADRGFIISKVGFQSGTKEAAWKTNITLTSLEDLRENLKKDVVLKTADSLEKRIAVILKRLYNLGADTKTGKGSVLKSYPKGVKM